MPLRSVHDSAFFRKLADARPESQELMAKWHRNSFATMNALDGITTCHICLASVTCDLVGILHEHNCALVRQTLQNKSRDFTRLFNSARQTTDAGSVERAEQERQILFCPACQKCHYCLAISVPTQFDVYGGFHNAQTCESVKLKCAIQDTDAPDYDNTAEVPKFLQWIQGHGYRFPAEYYHRFPSKETDWHDHGIQVMYCHLCMCPGHTTHIQS